MNIQEAKRIARQFMRDAYTDANLTQAIDHARAGKFSFVSCCCFVGLPTADHALRGHNPQFQEPHWRLADKIFPNAEAANLAACTLSRSSGVVVSDAMFQRRMIPMFLAEIKRRQYVAKASVVQSQESSVLQEA